MASNISEAELLDALNEALSEAGEGETGITTKQIRKATGWGEKKVLNALEDLIDGGVWEPCTVLRRSKLTGITRPVSGYRPVVQGD